MRLSDEVKVSIVTAVCVLALAIVAKYAIEAKLDFVSQYGPVWIYIAYIITKDRTKQRGRSMWLLWALAEIVATVAILVLYSF